MPCIEDAQALLDQFGFNFKVRVIANEDFKKMVLDPILIVSDGVADTNELFIRSYKMIQMFEGREKKGPIPAMSQTEDTYAELKVGKLAQSQMEEAKVFLPRDVAAVSADKGFRHVHVIGRCGYACENMDSFSLARKRISLLPEQDQKNGKPILVLNLANPVNPGGGVRNGAKAQEEDLCRKSSLLVSLEGRSAVPYYEYNRSLDTYMGSDAVMIQPQVEIIKDENGELLEDTAIAAVMTCAAPMIKYGMEGMSQKQYESMMLGRITGMLKVAAHLGYGRMTFATDVRCRNTAITGIRNGKQNIFTCTDRSVRIRRHFSGKPEVQRKDQ